MYTIRSDVWSSGLTLLELAMNRFPYPDDLDNPIELLSYIVRGEASPHHLTDAIFPTDPSYLRSPNCKTRKTARGVKK
jgi:serine/threonine protein kinase